MYAKGKVCADVRGKDSSRAEAEKIASRVVYFILKRDNGLIASSLGG
jgi:hypothetical protein